MFRRVQPVLWQGLKVKSGQNPAKARLNPSDPICIRPHLPGAETGESEPRPTSGPTSGPTSPPTRAPTRADFLVFSPSRTPRETSHEGVHGRAHEWTVGVHLSCFHLFCSLTSNPSFNRSDGPSSQHSNPRRRQSSRTQELRCAFQGQKRHPKELLRPRFRRTFG